MEEDKKKVQEREIMYGVLPAWLFAGGRDPTAMPNASKFTAHKDVLKNVTPKEPVQLELPFEEFKNAK